MNIFIASSSRYAPDHVKKIKNDKHNLEKHAKLNGIIKGLQDVGYTVIPWWSDEVWMDGYSFWDSLLTSLNRFNAGIFIFGDDDKIEENQNKSSYITRDSVLIEFGIYVAAKGKNRALAIYDYDDSLTYKIPGDLNGISFPNFEDSNLKNKIIDFFMSNNSNSEFEHGIKLYKNPLLASALFNRDYANSSSRGLWVGTKSAILWNQIENSPEYDKNIELITKIFDKRLTKNLDFNYIISFRPGNGNTDSKVVTKLIVKKNQFAEKQTCYIPIDINSMMLCKAIETVSTQSVVVPFGIVDDFEANFRYINSILSKELPKDSPKLFLMLGTTFSNLDTREDHFLNNVISCMSPKDYLLIDVILIKSNSAITDYTNFLNSGGALDNVYKDFLANAVIKRFSRYDAIAAGNLSVEKMDARMYANHSSVGKTEIVKFIYTPEKNQNLLLVKLYDFTKIKEYLQNNSRLTVSASIDGTKSASQDKSTNRAVFLLKLRSNGASNV